MVVSVVYLGWDPLLPPFFLASSNLHTFSVELNVGGGGSKQETNGVVLMTLAGGPPPLVMNSLAVAMTVHNRDPSALSHLKPSARVTHGGA